MKIGHTISRQGSIQMTYLFKQILNVTSVGDRKDIFDKYNLLTDNYARNQDAIRHANSSSEKDQLVADQMGLFALAAAGYDPQALPKFWDRFAATKGKTGNFFTDLFGTTSNDSKRLREMIKNVGVLPAACVESRKAVSTDEFQAWKSLVINYTGLGRKESIHSLISKISLEPALRSEVNHVRFSPDGKYVLAQDDSGISVLTRDPFTPLFRIPAQNAKHAQFTPDSHSIIFYNSSLRVETWDVEEQQLTTAYDMVIRRRCMQTALSPNGKLLSCMSSDHYLVIFDVATNNQLFEKKRFYLPSYYDVYVATVTRLALADERDDFTTEWMGMKFSPDSRYFVAAHYETKSFATAADAFIALDTQTMNQIQLKGQVKKLIAGEFTFVGPNKIAAVNPEDPAKSALISFPAGEILEQFELPFGRLTASDQADYLFVRPAGKFAVGVIRLSDKTMIIGAKTPAVDVHNDEFAAERIDGELALYTTTQNGASQTVRLPKNSFGRPRAFALSADLKWLAVSERTRGAVWNLTDGSRATYLRGFRGGYFADDNSFYTDIPKFEETERGMTKVDLSQRRPMETKPIGDKGGWQYGSLFYVSKPAKEKGGFDRDVIIELHDTRTLQTLWSKPFPKEAPAVWISAREENLVMVWATTSEAAKDEIKKDPKLTAQLSSMNEKEINYFIQVYDGQSGKITGQMVIESGKGSFRISEIFSLNDWVVVTDSQNRVRIYSLSTGKQLGTVFGAFATINSNSRLLCVENERGQLTIYDLASMEKRDQLTFSNPLSMIRFSVDGKKLFVLSANQTAYVLDVSSLSRADKP